MKLYILEGPDGSGKSTLARELGERHRATILHQGPFEFDPIYESYDRVHSVAHHDVAIFDRLHMGELVYGPICRRGVLCVGMRNAFTPKSCDRFAMLNRWLYKHHDLVHVLCLPQLDVVKENWGDSEQMYDVDRAEEVYNAYVELKEYFTHIYDYTAGVPFDA